MELSRDKTVREVFSRLQEAESKGVVRVAGTWGSFAPLLVSHLQQRLQRPVLYISPYIESAEKAAEDLQTFGAEGVKVLPAWEGGEGPADATDQTRAGRQRVVMSLLDDDGRFCIAASIQSICQPVPTPQVLKESCLSLEVDKAMSPEQAVGWLVDNGFELVEKIDMPGQFARRGGIVDIFSPLTANVFFSDDDSTGDYVCDSGAVRVEFFGDTIESIRRINLDTQRSEKSVEKVEIISVVCGCEESQQELFTNILPKETLIVFEQPGDCREVAEIFCRRADESSRLYRWKDIYEAVGRFTQLHISRFAGGVKGDLLNLNIKSISQYQPAGVSGWAGRKEALERLVEQSKAGTNVYLYCDRQAEINRVGEIITQSNKTIPDNFRLLLGFVNQGFYISSLKTVVIGHHELFGQFVIRRKLLPTRAGIPVDSLSDLQAGDYVVHRTYGIGKFIGIKTIADKNRPTEYLTIEYADRVKIHVSAANINLVQKYIGTGLRRPKLSKIGTKKWQRQKEKVIKSVRSLAVELLEVQAKRQSMGGVAFGEDSEWQAEFEESFPYQQTADQVAVSQEIKADMQQAVAMDRLLCGDVGYGKTELAMRAAFKAVEAGRQVAVLVPTTVLCVQHGRTFTERFADFPVNIAVLNRLKTPKEAKKIIAATKAGRVDIVIGTHRLLSGDVGFKDLGLLIIDEEQRFGVEHKERLKRLRVNVDVLTMTATPIPRTLHLSMLGLRDISSLQTPPLDRRSIVTAVTRYDKQLIKKAIVHELNRQGQVFFLHNRVRTIDKKAWEIRRLLEGTGAKVGIVHGRMAKSELERTMLDFVVGKIDVLVCTTIIESGLDIPNANTIFINNADRFGLAELHQLRGRVGRYKHRAYAFMLIPKDRPVTPTAARRLKAIEEYSHLGAGLRIALRDMEIRGAGNILGPEQSGHIQAVGYQFYCRLLAETVRKLKGQPSEAKPQVTLDIGFNGFIPRNYIPVDRERFDIYRKAAVASNDADTEQLRTDLTDIYGTLPAEVEMLLELAGLRIKAGKLGIKAIVASGQNLVFSFAEDINSRAKSLFTKVSGKVSFPQAKTVCLRLAKNYFEPATLLNVLRKILS